ncbi:MAG: radical SAM protein [Pseudomonadota bacterium]
MKKNNTLLIIPPFTDIIYSHSKIKAGVPGSPFLNMAIIASDLRSHGISVRILDLNLCVDYKRELKRTLDEYEPEFAGITFVTPLYGVMREVVSTIKAHNKAITVVAGGAHASAMPEDTLNSTLIDIVVIGEGDRTLSQIILSHNISDIKGIGYKSLGGIKLTGPSAIIEDMDLLPLPAWDLFDLSRYVSPRFMARRNPAGWLETSRGCPFECCYCNKSVFGRRFRSKSPARVIVEIKHMLSSGFKEIHIVDDMFTTDVSRVKAICDEIIGEKLEFPWATVTGIRVDKGDQEMFDLMRSAGCYRVYFGIESGDQNVLNGIGKKISLEQVVGAIAMAKKANLETCGFFMFGLPGETEETMKKTTRLACSLGLDWAKASIMVPLPATKIFQELEKAGKIKLCDWDKYNLYLPADEIYDHETLPWSTINAQFSAFYREFYFRPSVVAKKILSGMRNGTFVSDAMSFLRTKW